ncbi:PREDICTED: uncharacterized protein LOC108561767, partial [Nicrophorus vespilloides]|uniref:Uncharacterized protein LOC108561767 n=1 Tax=Nicrophorus vespilloides TaxID=110193 RepID=A0ABM1ML60_NICVS
MYLLLMFLFLPETSFGTKCGGFLTSPRGVISTPNFPNLFDTPIHCKWTIDNQNFPESWIAVYLTQVYVTEGLTFTENYSNYVKKVIYKAKEENIDTNYHVLSNSEQLEITLDLVNTEGTHLRVLDHLLDVYGFNITYEITELEYVRNESCTAWRCGFNGHCYDHFT